MSQSMSNIGTSRENVNKCEVIKVGLFLVFLYLLCELPNTTK